MQKARRGALRFEEEFNNYRPGCLVKGGKEIGFAVGGLGVVSGFAGGFWQNFWGEAFSDLSGSLFSSMRYNE